jgi:hypothetical protein
MIHKVVSEDRLPSCPKHDPYHPPAPSLRSTSQNFKLLAPHPTNPYGTFAQKKKNGKTPYKRHSTPKDITGQNFPDTNTPNRKIFLEQAFTNFPEPNFGLGFADPRGDLQNLPNYG